MAAILFSFPDDQTLSQLISKKANLPIGDMTLRHFPDGESYVRIHSDVLNQDVIIICSLKNPDPKIIPLIFLAQTAKRLGAKSVSLVAPYHAYMRQDTLFHEGESHSSKYFASVLSQYFDSLITIDPHLHRHHSLDEIYSIPTSTLHVASIIAKWIENHVNNPVLLGPDVESKQWVSQIAKKANTSFIVLEKIRRGDKDVEVSIPNVSDCKGCTPVLIDDIISTANTMIKTIQHLHAAHMKAPICIGIHAVFAEDAYQNLLQSGIEKVVTCNTIRHETNAIDISDVIVNQLKKQFFL